MTPRSAHNAAKMSNRYADTVAARRSNPDVSRTVGSAMSALLPASTTGGPDTGTSPARVATASESKPFVVAPAG